MNTAEKQLYRRLFLIVNLVYLLMIATVIYLVLKYALGLLLPLLIAWGLAALLQRPIDLLQQRFKAISRRLTAFFVVLIFVATVGAAAVLLAVALWDEVSSFMQSIPSALEQFFALISDTTRLTEAALSLPAWIRPYATRLLESVGRDMPGFLGSVLETLSQPLLGSVSAIGSFAMKLPSFLACLMISIISLVFITVDYAQFNSLLDLICPERLRQRLNAVKSCSCSAVIRLAKTYAFLMLLTFSELSVGFAVINLLGEKIGYVVPLAFLIALVDILPVLGVGTVLIPWAVFQLMQKNTRLAIMLLALYLIIVVVRNFLEPKLVGERFGLHPAVTLTALYVGGRLFGFIGVFALPLLIILAMQLYGCSGENKNPEATQ